MTAAAKRAQHRPLGENGGTQMRIEASKSQQVDLASSIESLVSKETDADLAEIQAMLAALEVPRQNVLLMPEGIEPAALHERSLWLSELCKREGFRFCPRLHVYLYGNRRGT